MFEHDDVDGEWKKRRVRTRKECITDTKFNSSWEGKQVSW